MRRQRQPLSRDDNPPIMGWMRTPPPVASEQSGYSAAQLRHFSEELRALRNSAPHVFLDAGRLGEQLSVQRAKTFATEGVGRRLGVIERCVLNVFRIYPPDRAAFLSKEECEDVAIHLQAFAVNVYALFDNVAWVCMLEAGGKLSPLDVSPFKPKCQQFLPPALQDYFAQPTVRKWFEDYGKPYRDSTVHRIAPYLPSRVLTREEAGRYGELHALAMQTLLGAAEPRRRGRTSELLDEHDRLLRERELLGRNSILVTLSMTGEDASAPVYLHPQLLCDWGLAQELVREYCQAMRQQYGWQAPSFPPMRVA